ncbi:uncharacterized protein [Primulina eburnea]|uniref:uncharacterized protein n=1 Tax=Primulina eburnea TaxID=1245227 RepID=UPI003C6C17C6
MHKSADCPKKDAPTTGRAYVMNAEEAEEEADTTLITGRIIIQGVATYALLDSGATHYFISETFIKRLNIIPEDMGLGFKVSIPSANGASIDFRQRSVFIRLPSGKSFVFEVARNKQMQHIISFLCARKLIRLGCKAFLACVTTARAPIAQKLEDVDIVRDFPIVFPEHVSGIPPDREVEFSIELMSGTVPISKAPYHLAPC